MLVRAGPPAKELMVEEALGPTTQSQLFDVCQRYRNKGVESHSLLVQGFLQIPDLLSRFRGIGRRRRSILGPLPNTKQPVVDLFRAIEKSADMLLRAAPVDPGCLEL